jgi:hypothetical protein
MEQLASVVKDFDELAEVLTRDCDGTGMALVRRIREKIEAYIRMARQQVD